MNTTTSLNIVTATCKKGMKGIEDSINKEDIKYAKRANILDRMETNGTSISFVTLKERPHIKLCQPSHNNTNIFR